LSINILKVGRFKGIFLYKKNMPRWILLLILGIDIIHGYLSPLWTPYSWKFKTVYQNPDYPDLRAVEEVVKTLSTQAPLIFAGEAEALKSHLSEVATGRRFLITGGDCAETFDDFSATKIKEDLQLLMQMSLICAVSPLSRLVVWRVNSPNRAVRPTNRCPTEDVSPYTVETLLMICPGINDNQILNECCVLIINRRRH